ncbi:MAG: TolC family protein [Pseudomonadota bacterium]
MPKSRKNGSGNGVKHLVPALVGLALLAGCMGGAEAPSMLQTHDQAGPGAVGALGQPAGSGLIGDLQARKSVLPKGGAYAKVSDAVISASSGAAGAELRVAQLKASAQSKNWLPSIGPSVNLTNLGGLAASLLLEQSLFDNGRRKAERAYASADVEVAAVTLSTAMNQRVFEGLTYYVNAERARAQAVVGQAAAGRLQEFSVIMGKRVAGGLSDGSEMQVLNQHLAEMQATVAADQQTQSSAMAQLAALTEEPMNGVSGLDSLPDVGKSNAEPLAVLQARGEGTRAIAQAQMQLAGLKFGLSATAGLDEGGVNPGVRLNGAGLLNPGAKDNIAALQQTGDVVDRQTAEAAETANRRIVALQQQKANLASRRAQGDEVLRQTGANLDLFNQQYKVGRRTLLELVSQYDAYARLQRDQASLGYDMALIDLEIARDRGVLVDGARM